MIEVLLRRPALRRLLFVPGNIAAALLVGLVCVVPVREIFASRDGEIRQQREILSRLKAITARAENIRSPETDATSGEGEFLSGKNDGVVGADLQTRFTVLQGTSHFVSAALQVLA